MPGTYYLTPYSLNKTIPENTTKIMCEGLTMLPEGIFDNLPFLENLSISHERGNSVSELPSLDDCISLKKLNCNSMMGGRCPHPSDEGNTLTELPSLDNCPLLEELHCIGNYLSKLPSLDKCTLLKKIDCRDNALVELPSLDKCTLLKKLDCEYNYLEELPSLDKCTRLRELDCACNRNLKTLPSLDNCTLLKAIYCVCCDLIQFPSLSKCILLEELRCGGNSNLGKIPYLGNCTLLKSFDCSDNRLRMLPFLPSNLTYISCDNNLFEDRTLDQLFLFQQVRIIVRCLQFIHKLRYKYRSRSTSSGENIVRLALVDSLSWRPPHLRLSSSFLCKRRRRRLSVVDVGGIHFQEGLEDTLILLAI